VKKPNLFGAVCRATREWGGLRQNAGRGLSLKRGGLRCEVEYLRSSADHDRVTGEGAFVTTCGNLHLTSFRRIRDAGPARFGRTGFILREQLIDQRSTLRAQDRDAMIGIPYRGTAGIIFHDHFAGIRPCSFQNADDEAAGRNVLKGKTRAAGVNYGGWRLHLDGRWRFFAESAGDDFEATACSGQDNRIFVGAGVVGHVLQQNLPGIDDP
jgi:hypothetical protein